MIAAHEARATLALALIATPLLAAAAWAAPHDDASHAPTAVVRVLSETPCRTDADAAKLARRLADLGPAATDELFHLVDLTRPPVERRATHAESMRIEDARLHALVDALVALPRRDVLARIERVPTEEPRLRTLETALVVLAEIGREEDTALALELARAAEELAPRGAREAFGLCLERVLTRETAARRILLDVYGRAPAGLAPTIVRAASTLEPDVAREALAGLLEHTPGVDALILTELVRLGPVTTGGAVERGSALRVRSCLRRHDATVQALAASACGMLGDDQAVGPLVDLLHHEDATVRDHALRALRDVARLGLGDDVGAWERWYAEERAWWEGEARAALAELPRMPAADAVESIRTLARRRLFRREIAEALARALDRREPDVVRLAVATLGEYGFPESAPALTSALHYPDQDVRVAARTALDRIAGVSPPPRP